MKNRRRNHPARTKEMLLPLPPGTVRSISLENHLALATIQSGHGTQDTMIALLRVLYMTFFLVEPTCSQADIAFFLDAESVLDENIRTASESGDWKLPLEQLSTIEVVLRRSDDVVGRVPKYRYTEAWERLKRFAASSRVSPLPGSQVGFAWRD